LVPLIFEAYAKEMAKRVQKVSPRRLLEIAAGTGVLTRALAAISGAGAQITASDLNSEMLEEAARIGTPRPVEWRQADALALPFEKESFDVVVCQFGVMFFGDKQQAFSEARRVLVPGGVLLFSV